MALLPMEQNQGTLKSITASITTNASGSGILKYNSADMTTDIQVIQAYIQGYKSFVFPYNSKWYMNVGDVNANGYTPVSSTFNVTVWVLE